jgi:hypothetical protein
MRSQARQRTKKTKRTKTKFRHHGLPVLSRFSLLNLRRHDRMARGPLRCQPRRAEALLRKALSIYDEVTGILVQPSRINVRLL